MSPEIIEKFNRKINNNIDFKAKVLIWHLLIAKVFLDIYFEKYYINFIKDAKFDEKKFLSCVWYIDLMLNWENYTDRYCLFEENQDLIIDVIKNKEIIPLSLRQSIISDLNNIIWEKDENWLLISAPYSLDFLKNEENNKIVKNWINDFFENEFKNLKKVLTSMEIDSIKNWFLARIKEIL